MKKSLAAAIVLTFTSLATAMAQQTDGWINYSSAEGRYTVSLPAQPKISSQESSTADGKKFPQYLAMVTEPGDVVYIVAYFDSLPGTTFSQEKARDGMVAAVKGTLVNETAISLGGYSGRELNISTMLGTDEPKAGTEAVDAVEYFDKARFYEVEKRVYVLQLLAPKSLWGAELKAKAAKYFDSFQIIKQQASF